MSVGPSFPGSARVAVLRRLLARLGHRRAGGDPELLHHREDVELAPALGDQPVAQREDVDAPDAHPPVLRREAEHLAGLLPGDHSEVGGGVALDHDELGAVVEVGDRGPEVRGRLRERCGAGPADVEEARRRMVVELGGDGLVGGRHVPLVPDLVVHAQHHVPDRVFLRTHDFS